VPDPDSRLRRRWSPLAREITAVLLLKAVALYVIWLAFFSTPSGRTLDAGGVARSLVSPPAQVDRQETGRAARPGTR
jgi:hypothetical protein